MPKLMNRRDYGDSLLILATLVALSRKPPTSIGGGNSHKKLDKKQYSMYNNYILNCGRA